MQFLNNSETTLNKNIKVSLVVDHQAQNISEHILKLKGEQVTNFRPLLLHLTVSI